VALITASGGYFAASVNQEKSPLSTNVVPPATNVRTVDVRTAEHFGEQSDEAFSLLRDMSIFDLRSWRPVPESEKKNKRYSPVNYINYLHLKKVRPANIYYAHYDTPGSIIDLRCITHPAKIITIEKSEEHPGENWKEYIVEADVSEIPLNEEFLIVIEATYWNLFQNLAEEEASTYTDQDITALGELGLIVFFPASKPFKKYSLWSRVKPTANTTNKEKQYISPTVIYADTEAGRFIYWNITTRQSDHYYKLKWAW
jgi:hypothetical protein